MHQETDNPHKIYTIQIFNVSPISVCAGIDANSEIFNHATTSLCWNGLGECFNSLFQLSRKTRFLFVRSSFSRTSEEKVKRRKMWTMGRPFELCLQAPNFVSEPCVLMGHCLVCYMGSCTIMLEPQKSLGLVCTIA